MNNAIGQKEEAMTKKPSEFNPETAPPALTIDWDAYLPFFEDEDISEEDKHELIEALWAIVVGFVDLGFRVHPSQQNCGDRDAELTRAIADVLSSEEGISNQFEQVASPNGGG